MKNTIKNYKPELQRYFRFCPHCGSRFKLVPHEQTRELACPTCGYIMWLNSKPTASCLLINNKKEVLLAKRAKAPNKGWYDVPGGFLELGETPEAGVKREIKEELGITLKRMMFLPCAYVGTYHTSPIQISFNVYYAAKLSTRVRINPHDDVADVEWISLSRLPRKIAFENNRKALAYLARYYSAIWKQLS